MELKGQQIFAVIEVVIIIIFFIIPTLIASSSVLFDNPPLFLLVFFFLACYKLELPGRGISGWSSFKNVSNFLPVLVSYRHQFL